MHPGPKPKPREELAPSTIKKYEQQAKRIKVEIEKAIVNSVPVRYDITTDDYLPITQEWVTEVQNKVTELALKLKKKDEQIEMLEAMLKV